MLQFNGNTYVRSYPTTYNHPDNNISHSKLPYSTASVSSNLSDSCRSISKYSFKTGKSKNVLKSKNKPQNFSVHLNGNSQNHIYRHQFQQKKPSLEMKAAFQKNIYLTSNSLGIQQKIRGKSCNSSTIYYKRIPDPPIRPCLKYQTYHNNYHKGQIFNNQKKIKLQETNSVLKKSVSQKKFFYDRKFSQLNLKINYLKDEFKKQQSKMQKVSSVIKQYFG